MKIMYFSIKYRCDILLKKNNFIYTRLFCCNHTCYCVGMVLWTPGAWPVTLMYLYRKLKTASLKSVVRIDNKIGINYHYVIP